MPVILITIKTLQPLLATSFQGDPNSDVSYDYIPGSMLRGALIGRYLRHYRQRDLDLSNAEVQRLFFEANSTRYLNAYLVSKQEPNRTVPLPRSWYKEKNAEFNEEQLTELYDFSVERDDEELKSLQFVGNYFCTCEEDRLQLYQPSRRINIHNQRDRVKGRSSKRENQPDSEGAIFRYDALDAGQTFQAVVLCQAEDIPLLEQLLTQPNLWLGGSRSAGYGKTQISYEIKDDTEWQEVFFKDGDDEHLTITLLSDTILRDENGQFVADPSLIQTEINELLGISLPNPSNEKTFSSHTLIGGFNRKWGLPLPQVPALATGTVLVFEDATLTDEQIQQLEWEGIGDRKNEGFGRIAVNWHKEKSFDTKLPQSSKPIQQPSISPTSLPLAEMLAKQLLRQKLDRVLQAEVDHRTLETGKISNSQLSRLRMIARQGLNSEPVTLQPVRDLLKDENLTKNAKEQFQQTQLEQNDSLFKWLQEKIANPQNWVAEQHRKVKLSEEVEATLDESLATEYTLKLIMAVAKKATKENQQ